MTRRYDPRRARSHLNYTRAELARLFSVGLATICAWKRNGLQPMDGSRPYLFAGADVRQFLEKHNKPRQRLEPGQIYCVACKQAMEPLNGVATYAPLSDTLGNLIGTCANCGRRVWRRVRNSELLEKAGKLKIQYEGDAATLSSDGEPLHTEPSDEVSS
ncbi:hypothetical protein GRI40_10925 [Altererythrobacter aerius]|uniref:DNA-binding protein n=1 Tax=Tsuneonella aeria TaxID=1837929 RepID=A0A6I4TI60_9SPHN|nr:helix-turn-helix domain-containing protein [Tsuneonella aeria]MXO75730.1 hypothetical protein [Tsuneonella aeria]